MSTPLPHRVIIVAAGRGARLMPYTEERPKCLVPIAGKPMLRRQIESFLAQDVREFVVIAGYLAPVLETYCRNLADELGCSIHFVLNPEYETNNVLHSLFYANSYMHGNIAISYGDIIYTSDVARALCNAAEDICLVVDRDFREAYLGRSDHPLDEAEVATVAGNGSIDKVGKRAVPPGDAWGEYIGLTKLSNVGTECVNRVWQQLQTAYAGRLDQPFQRAGRFRNAYLTDLWQHLIDNSLAKLVPVEIHGCWREIDTGQDHQRAEALLGCGQKEWK